MSVPNLEEVLAQYESPVERFRSLDTPPGDFIWRQPHEYTNWIEEQRAWREGVAFRDMSHHMLNLYVEGPDAVDLFKDYCVNDFTSLEAGDPPQAKQIVCCNPDGDMIGDAVLYYIAEDTYVVVGTRYAPNWLQYNAETGDYDVTIEEGNNPLSDDSPQECRFQVQGPDAKAVLSEIVDGDLPDLSFFEMAPLSVAGHDCYALRHGMAGSYGLEISAPFAHHEDIEDAIREAGDPYDIQKLGSGSYKTATIEIGWIAAYVPAIYGRSDLEDYREWLTVRGPEASQAIRGSFYADDIEDYYLDPVDVGYGHLVDFDHDFPGREALTQKIRNPERKRVTLEWNDEDVIDVFASLFEAGETYKSIPMPDPGIRGPIAPYDRVEKDGDIVGVSKNQGYIFPERSMLSIAVIDTAHADPGSEVTVVWGDRESSDARIERHVETEITATVRPSPLYGNRG